MKDGEKNRKIKKAEEKMREKLGKMKEVVKMSKNREEIPGCGISFCAPRAKTRPKTVLCEAIKTDLQILV